MRVAKRAALTGLLATLALGGCSTLKDFGSAVGVLGPVASALRPECAEYANGTARAIWSERGCDAWICERYFRAGDDAWEAWESGQREKDLRRAIRNLGYVTRMCPSGAYGRAARDREREAQKALADYLRPVKG